MTIGLITKLAKYAEKLINDAGIRADLADPSKGAGLSAWKISKLTKAIENAGDALNHLEVPVWAFAKKAVGYVEDGDPSTWDWGPAILAADAAIDATRTVLHGNPYPGGVRGSSIPGLASTLSSRTGKT